MKHILRYNGMTRTRIHTRIHTYPDIFESATISFRIQKFSRPLVSVFKSNLPVHSYPTHIRILSSTQDSFGNIGIRACVLEREICILLCLERTWERGCHCEYSIHGKELGLILLRHRIKKNRYLKIRRRRRQRERLKSHRFNKQTTTLHVHHTFLYISSSFLQDYDVKMPNFMF